MSTVRETAYTQAASQYQETNQSKSVSKKEETSDKKKVTSGRTYGDPELSEAGLKYYNSLKQKFGGMNFVLVSSDKKAEADAKKGSFAVAGKMTVLIDEEKIERMATDEKYRKQVEATISNASTGVNQLRQQLAKSGTKVNAFGMSIKKDGTAEFFAVMDKSFKSQSERLAKKREEAKKTKRDEAKKAKREEAAKRLEERREEDDEETVTLTASSPEELLKKIQDYQFGMRSDSVQTEEEKQVGQSVDYTV
ncbi:MAG: DUF6033 family protein [Butyrivibrio sp.]|nr:DUF6033 family protein [Butyrivibrio sp.]